MAAAAPAEVAAATVAEPSVAVPDTAPPNLAGQRCARRKNLSMSLRKPMGRRRQAMSLWNPKPSPRKSLPRRVRNPASAAAPQTAAPVKASPGKTFRDCEL